MWMYVWYMCMGACVGVRVWSWCVGVHVVHVSMCACFGACVCGCVCVGACVCASGGVCV